LIRPLNSFGQLDIGFTVSSKFPLHRTPKLYMPPIEALLNRPSASSPMKAPARTDRNYPMLKVMTANILYRCQ
jgi:hypothetical protein